MTVKLYPHQIKAVEEMSNGKVLVGGVGTGKTITSLVYFYTKVMGGVLGDFDSIKSPMDLYVFTTARKRDELDWQTEAMKLGISTHDDAGIPGMKLTVESYNNIEKFKDVTNAFIILDEQRMVGSGAWTKTFIKLAKANRWIMLSATPGDKWEDYIPLFVANGFYKNRTEFKRQHCVYSYFGRYPKLERYLEVGRLVRLRNSILVDMPYRRHTTRHIHTVKVDYDKELFERVLKKRWHVYENRPLKDVSELFSAMRKVANSDVSRLDAVRDLMSRHPRLIVFYNFDYELELLRSLANSLKEPNLSSNPLEDGRCEATSQSPKKTSSTPTQTQSTSSGEIWDTRSTTEEIQIQEENSTRHNKDSTHSGSSSTSDISGSRTSDTKRSTSIDQSISARFMTRLKRSLTTPLESTIRIGQHSCQDKSFQDTADIESSSSIPTVESNVSGVGQSSMVKCDPERTTSTTSITTFGSMCQLVRTAGESTTSGEERLLRKNIDDFNESRICPPKNTCECQICLSGSKDNTNHRSTDGSQSRWSGQTTPQIAEWNGHKHEKIPDSDSWVYLVQYVAGAEAWNCTKTNAVVFYSMTYSYKNFEQAQGRIDRLDTPFSDLHYYVLTSDSLIDKAVAKSLRNKKDFNEKEYLRK